MFGRKQRKAEQQARVDELIAEAQRAAGYDPAAMGAIPSMDELLATAASTPPPDMRYIRLNEVGVETPGVVLSVAPVDSPSPYGSLFDLVLRVEPPGAAPYEVHSRHTLAAGYSWEPGPATLRVDPDDPSVALVWSQGATATAPAEVDPLDALAALADRRDAGLITDAEFEAEKARLLG